MSMMRMNYRSQLLGKYVDITVVFPTDRMTLPPDRMSNLRSPLPDRELFEWKPGMKYQTIYLIHGGETMTPSSTGIPTRNATLRNIV